MAERTFRCVKEQSVGSFGGVNRGNGGDDHAPIGKTGTTVFRELLQFDNDWTKVYQIKTGKLRVKSTTQVHLVFGGSAHIVVRRLSPTASWVEGGGGENTWGSGAGAGTVFDGETLAPWPSPIDQAHGSGQNDWWVVDITDILEKMAPASVLRRNGKPCGGDTNRGIRIASSDESSTTRSIEFYSRRAAASNRPEVVLNFDDNQPPAIPTVISPEPSGTDAVIVASTAGTALTVEFTFTDPDDAAPGKAELEVWTDATTDLTATDANVTSARIGTTGATTGFRSLGGGHYAITLTGLPARTVMRHRLRVSDPQGAWCRDADGNGWTSLAAGRIKTAYIPGVPLNAVFQTTTVEPHVLGTLNGPGALSGWEGEFYKVNLDGTRTPLWSPNTLPGGAGGIDVGGGTRSDIPYRGDALGDGDVVHWRHRHRNDDGVLGEWSSFTDTTMRTQVGPTVTPGDTGTQLNRRTGPVTITAASFDGYAYRLWRGETQVYPPNEGTPAIVSVGATTSVAISLADGYLSWGDTFGFEAAVRPAGTSSLGPFCPRVELYVDTLPTTALTITDADGNVGPVLPTTDLLFVSPYLDPDAARYGETPATKEIEVRAAATPQGSGALILRRSSYSPPESEHTGRQLDPLTAATNTAPDAGVTADVQAIAPTGYSGNSLRVRATGGSSTDRGAFKACAVGAQDLSYFSQQATIRLWRRVTSETNLTRWFIRFLFATSSDWAGYAIYEPATDAVDTWDEVVLLKGAPSATHGTVDWSLWQGVVDIFADVSGAYTGDCIVRDLRIGITQTAKDTPDGYIAPESSVDVRVRYRDYADPLGATTLAAASAIGATNIKVGSVSGLAPGQDITIQGAGAAVPYLESRTIVTVGTAGSGGTGVTITPALSYAHASADPVYRLAWGPWTPWQTRKASRPPVVAAVTPADHAQLGDPTPTLAHTYSSPGGKAQTLRTLRVYRRRGHLAHILDSYPSSHWKLSEASGSFADSAGAVTGTLFGGASRNVTGLVSGDGAVDLDGSGYINFSDVYDFAGNAPFSVAAWIRPDGLAAAINPLLVKDDNTSGWLLWVTSAGALGFSRKVAFTPTVAQSADGLIAVGSTHHVAAVYQGTNSLVYLDGVAVASIADVTSLPGNVRSFAIGQFSTYKWDGVVDEVTVWAGGVTAAELSALAGKADAVPGDELLYELDISGAGLSDTLPALLLEDAGDYAWEITAYDSDALYGTTTRRSFSTAFTTPAAVSNLTATVDDDAQSITLAWTASADTYLDHYRVYWRDDASGQPVRIDGGPETVDDGRTKLTATTFTWYGGRLGVNAFLITVHNGAQESEAATIEATQASARPGSWMLAGDGVARYTYPFNPESAPRVTEGEVETFRPPGRPSPVHLFWGSAGRRFTTKLTYLPGQDGDLSSALRELRSRGTAVWVKAPAPYLWDVMRVRVVGMSDEAEDASFMSVSLDLDEVDRSDV